MSANMDEVKYRVWDANQELVRKGVVIYTWGNVSEIVPEEGLVVIKPRAIPYENLKPEDMTICDMDGRRVEGRFKESVDLDIHMAIYRAFPQIRAIAHTHSTYATAFAQAGVSLPILGTTHADSFYGRVPCTRYQRDGEMGDLYERYTGEMIVEKFQEDQLDPMLVQGVLAACHGPFTWGHTAAAAAENSVILEEVAKMAYLTLQLNAGAPQIRQALIDKHFLRKHGPDAYFTQDE